MNSREAMQEGETLADVATRIENERYRAMPFHRRHPALAGALTAIAYFASLAVLMPPALYFLSMWWKYWNG